MKLNHTKQCLENTAVKISACTTRRRADSASAIKPILPKSTCNSTPGSPSATRTVVPRTERPTPITSNA